MTKITAKFDSRCPACNGFINAGSTVEWSPGTKARHVACKPSAGSTQPKNLSSGAGVAPKPGTNKKAGYCEDCGSFLAIGSGHLYKCIPDSDCMKHFNTDDGGWHVVCLDKEACKASKATQKVAAQAQAETAKTKAAEQKALRTANEDALKALRESFKAQGWESTSCKPDGLQMIQGPVLHQSLKGGSYYDVRIVEATFADGTKGAYETANGHDDYRFYYLVPAATANAWRLAHAEKHGITKEKAQDWLAKYAQCEGADIYKAVLEKSP